jgi:4-diphosphocytidyl-2-C-methyl-D-erythritol kinase
MNLLNDSTDFTVRAPAKVNWYLELLSKRDDGFHQIETYMSTVSLYDTLSFSARSDSEISLRVIQDPTVDAESIPDGADNLVLKAAEAVRSLCLRSDAQRGVDIVLRKRIPSAAGLGGASSDAAATIKALNYFWGSTLTANQMHETAAQLGSDVPFFLTGGTAFCEGRGELISSLNVPTGHWIVIGKPSTGLSTPKVFSRVSLSGSLPISKLQHRAAEFGLRLKEGRIAAIGRSLCNRLQRFAVPLNDEIAEVRKEFQLLQDLGRCCGHQLSGSGSSYFGLFHSKRLATNTALRLRARMPDCRFYCCQTVGAVGAFDASVMAMAV